MPGIESIMNREVVTVGGDDTVKEAATLMRNNKLGALVVVADGRIHGVLSERDVLFRVVAEGLDPAATKVADVCTTNPVTVLASESVEGCFKILREQGFRHLPIRDEEQKPVGIVSSRDFMWGLLMSVERDSDIEEVCRKLGHLGNVLNAAQERYPES